MSRFNCRMKIDLDGERGQRDQDRGHVETNLPIHLVTSLGRFGTWSRVLARRPEACPELAERAALRPSRQALSARRDQIWARGEIVKYVTASAPLQDPGDRTGGSRRHRPWNRLRPPRCHPDQPSKAQDDRRLLTCGVPSTCIRCEVSEPWMHTGRARRVAPRGLRLPPHRLDTEEESPQIMPTVTVDGEKSFEVEPGKKLVLAIEDAGIDIMHRCGGNARVHDVPRRGPGGRGPAARGARARPGWPGRASWRRTSGCPARSRSIPTSGSP